MAPKKVILSCLISEHTESVSNNRHWFSVRLLSDLSMIVKSDGQIHLLASQVSKQNSQIHLFQSSPQNWKPNPLENPQPREVARALVEAACVVFFLKTAVGNCTLYHRNFPTSKTFRKKTNRLNFPVTKKTPAKDQKLHIHQVILKPWVVRTWSLVLGGCWDFLHLCQPHPSQKMSMRSVNFRDFLVKVQAFNLAIHCYEMKMWKNAGK